MLYKDAGYRLELCAIAVLLACPLALHQLSARVGHCLSLYSYLFCLALPLSSSPVLTSTANLST